MKCSLPSVIAAFAAALVLTSTASALAINGAINFNGTPVVDNPGDFANSTRINSIGDLTVGLTHTGSYNTIATNTPATFATPLIYSPATVPAGNLWSVVVGPTTYTFTATSMASMYTAATSTWSMAGVGFANITNFDTTPGNYNITLTRSEAGANVSFSFAATTAVAPAPDGGVTAALLGIALLGVGLFRRKLAK